MSGKNATRMTYMTRARSVPAGYETRLVIPARGIMGATISALPNPQHHAAFYAAAVAGLRVLDTRERVPRRFGADADTRWASFKGALTDSDRIDILLRDAAVTWGAAFSPAEVFGLFGLAPDEPFGPDWNSLPASAARRAFADPGQSGRPAELARTLGIAAQDVTLPALTPSTRLAVAGGTALLAVGQAFASRPDLRWSDQVLAVATEPPNRHLAGLLAIAVNSPARTRLIRPSGDVRTSLKGAGFTQFDTAVVSADAEPACASFAYSAAGAA